MYYLNMTVEYNAATEKYHLMKGGCFVKSFETFDQASDYKEILIKQGK